MAMALPAMFAACSSDELETIQNTESALKGRVDLGVVELSFGDDAQTRMSAEGRNIKFLVGDGVGACLVDDYNKISDKPEDILKNYKLTSNIQTNYQYKYDGSTWNTTARMVEGNYIFYAPYNGDHLSRTPLNTGVPAIQELGVGADGKLDQFSIIDAFVKSGQPAYVGYKFLKAEGQTTKVAVSLKPIFAYPLITFSNDKTTGADAADVTITKFVISTTGGFATEMPLSIGTAGNIASKEATGIVGSLFDEAEKDADKGAWVTSKYMIGNKTTNVADVDHATKKANMITVNVPGGALKVAKGESVKFNVVIPATSAVYDVYAYLENGKAYKLEAGAVAFSAGKIYPDNQYKADGTTLATAAGAMTMKTSALAANDAPVIVNTTDELVALVGGATADVANIQIGSSDVKITKAVVDAANPTLTYSFKDAVTIATGADAVTLKNFEFNANVTIESGDVTYGGENAFKIEATVKNGAKLTILNATDASTVATEAGATAVIGSAKATDAEVTIASLTNAGEATINVKGIVKAVDANTGTITNESIKLPESIVGKWINNADVTLNAGTTIAEAVAANNGTPAKPAGYLTNNGSVTVDNTNTLTIGAGATLNNAAGGMIINNGTGGVTVTGTLEAYGYFKGVAITTTAGRINLHNGYQAANPFTVSGSGLLADVMETYDATATTKPTLTDNANMLSVKNLTIKTADEVTKANYELQDGGTLYVSGNIKLTKAANILTAGNATITGVYTLEGDDSKILAIKVAEGGQLTLKGITLGDKTTTTTKGYTTLSGALKGTEITSTYKLTQGASVDGVTVDTSTINDADKIN